jgi:hypothetical protein
MVNVELPVIRAARKTGEVVALKNFQTLPLPPGIFQFV